jgi:hypothetical protein
VPWCPVCRYEYEAGITECPDDKVPLVDELPPEPELVEAVEVYRSSQMAAVDAVASWLKEHGLDPEVIDRPAGGLMGASPAFAVTLDSEAAEAVADDLDLAIEEIEAGLTVGLDEADLDEPEAGDDDEDEEEENEEEEVK